MITVTFPDRKFVCGEVLPVTIQSTNLFVFRCKVFIESIEGSYKIQLAQLKVTDARRAIHTTVKLPMGLSPKNVITLEWVANRVVSRTFHVLPGTPNTYLKLECKKRCVAGYDNTANLLWYGNPGLIQLDLRNQADEVVSVLSYFRSQGPWQRAHSEVIAIREQLELALPPELISMVLDFVFPTNGTTVHFVIPRSIRAGQYKICATSTATPIPLQRTITVERFVSPTISDVKTSSHWSPGKQVITWKATGVERVRIILTTPRHNWIDLGCPKNTGKATFTVPRWFLSGQFKLRVIPHTAPAIVHAQLALAPAANVTIDTRPIHLEMHPIPRRVTASQKIHIFCNTNLKTPLHTMIHIISTEFGTSSFKLSDSGYATITVPDVPSDSLFSVASTVISYYTKCEDTIETPIILQKKVAPMHQFIACRRC